MRALGVLIAGVLLSFGLRADADGSLLHEYFVPDPNEDVAFSATTLDGELPAAIQTPSGVVTAPDPRREPDADRVYSGHSDDGPGSTYEPDRDTRRPDVEMYDDPFSPSTAPFKRLRAFDKVEEDYTLSVDDAGLQVVPVGGSLGVGDEAFYADLSIDLLPKQPVRIPTVGPGAQILKLHVNPEADLTVLRDGAENWFVRGTEKRRVRLVMELSIPRATFGSEFADVEWADLRSYARAPRPAAHEKAFAEVVSAIGLNGLRPREALQKMVDYFRSFEESQEPPRSRGDIYLDLTLSKKGVCRHRSFAFLVTAIHLQLPARMVVNEAHAWVEVFDGNIWHRVDLGGAALDLDADASAAPPHVPPPDPYAWPGDQDSGQRLADRIRESQGRPTSSDSSDSPTNSSSPDGPPSSTEPTPTTPDPTRPPTNVEVATGDIAVKRGATMIVRGKVTTESGEPCAHLRVDVALKSKAFPKGRGIGSLSTNDRGEYDGSVSVPRDFVPGDYELMVTTTGDSRCAAGRSE